MTDSLSCRQYLLISFLEDLIFICLSALVLGNSLGASGIWAAYPAGEVLTFAFIFCFVYFKCGKAPLRAEDYIVLPEDFDLPECDIFDRTARSSKDVAEIAKEAEKFCLSHGEDPKTSRNASLAVEEFGLNLVKWGFGKKSKSIDIRMVKKDFMTLRIRDDCAAFNPKDWLAVHADKNTEHNGIRMICAMAHDVQYFSVMGFNNLIVKL